MTQKLYACGFPGCGATALRKFLNAVPHLFACCQLLLSTKLGPTLPVNSGPTLE